MNPEIIGIGIATIDHLYLLEDIARLPGGRVLDYSIQGGGMAATAMAASARLGVCSAAVVCVGEDERGEQVLRGLEECGVDVSACCRRPGATPMVTVLVDGQTAERHFLPLRCESPRPGPDDINWELASQANVCLVDSCTREVGRVLEHAQRVQLTTMVDTEYQPDKEPHWVEHVDIYIGSGDRPEWREDPEKALQKARRTLDLGPHTAIVTLGKAGCVGAGPEGDFRISAMDVDVVDTCGAGDVFRGGYAFALEQGWRARHCAVFAGATSALSTMKLGGRAGLPDAAQVAELLVQKGQEGPWEELRGEE